MPIKINISLSSGGRFKPVSSHTFHDKLITVGRDRECTLSLEDTQKHVSRRHAEFEEGGDCYWVKVVSKVNPIAVNGKRFAFGERVRLVEGDQVHVGLYRLEIIDADTTPIAKPQPAPAVSDDSDEITIEPAPNPRSTDPQPALRDAAPATGPATPLPPAADEETTYVPPPKATEHASPAAPPRTTPSPATLPDSALVDDEVTYIPPMWARLSGNRTAESSSDAGDLTHIGRPQPTPSHAPPAQAQMPQSDPGTPAGTAPAELDFDLSDAFDTPQAQAPVTRLPEPRPEVEEGFSDDVTYVRRPAPKPPANPQPDAAMPSASAPASAPRPAGAEAPASKPQFRSPLAEIQARIAAKSSEVQPAPSRSAAASDPAVNAFLEGAGLSHLQVSNPEVFMRHSGELVRTAVAGILTLLSDRVNARNDLGLATMSEPDANPISASANPDEVITFLFDPKRPPIGDTDPAQAFTDACSDLRDHQAALISAMRAAVMTALLKIDPKRIEREHGSSLGVLNITRRSKLWDISVAQHDQLAREIEQNFGAVFGQEIAAAFAEYAKKNRGG